LLFSTHEPFPSLWKTPLDLLKEKHLFPGETQNTYQTGEEKKKGKKRKKNRELVFFCSSRGKKKNTVCDPELCILSWNPFYRNKAQRDGDDALQWLVLQNPTPG